MVRNKCVASQASWSTESHSSLKGLMLPLYRDIYMYMVELVRYTVPYSHA